MPVRSDTLTIPVQAWSLAIVRKRYHDRLNKGSADRQVVREEQDRGWDSARWPEHTGLIAGSKSIRAKYFPGFSKDEPFLYHDQSSPLESHRHQGLVNYPLSVSAVMESLLKPVASEPLNILLINGPNLNLLGIREPGTYGSATLKDVERLCADVAKEHRASSFSAFQSNHEGAIVDKIHEARVTGVDAIVINPGALDCSLRGSTRLTRSAGAYTHTSVAIRDAFAGTEIPFVEVRLESSVLTCVRESDARSLKRCTSPTSTPESRSDTTRI